MLDSITLYVGSYLSEIGDTFSRLVYTHAKGDGGHNDVDAFHQKVVLRF